MLTTELLPAIGAACHVVPVADPYCTLHPVIETVSVPRLNNSTKSFRHVAPVFPPPP